MSRITRAFGNTASRLGHAARTVHDNFEVAHKVAQVDVACHNADAMCDAYNPLVKPGKQQGQGHVRMRTAVLGLHTTCDDLRKLAQRAAAKITRSGPERPARLELRVGGGNSADWRKETESALESIGSDDASSVKTPRP